MIPFEDDNLKSFALLERIEIGLRELVKDELQSGHGGTWHKLLPGDVLVAIRESMRDEEKRRHFGFVRLGPLYYMTFGQLVDFVATGHCSSVRQRLGGEGIVAQLVSLLPVRNAICHCRSCGDSGHQLVRAVYDECVTAIGSEAFALYCGSPSTGLWPSEGLKLIREWVREVLSGLKQLRSPLPRLDAANSQLRNQLWLDDAVAAGVDRVQLTDLDKAIKSYNEPTGVGAAANRHSIVANLKMVEMSEAILAKLHPDA